MRCAFLGTNPTDEPITSGLPVTREHFSPTCERPGGEGQSLVFVFSGAGRVVPVGSGQ